LIPDPERAPHIRRAFELMATGNFKKAEVLKIVTDDGLRTRHGKKLSAQTFEKTLRKFVYCGQITASCLDAPVKGLYEPLVSEDLFRAVQDVLDGRRLSIAPKRKHNPNFPLKWFVRCAVCGTPITGGAVTGKKQEQEVRLLLVPKTWLQGRYGAQRETRSPVRRTFAANAARRGNDC
jgi:hypothetical protein